MTLDQAIKALDEGKKITHHYFSAKEYIVKKDGSYYFEDDVVVPEEWWDKNYLEKNWSLFN